MTDFGRTYFDALYEANPDPWRFRTSPYEREKYARTLATLPRPRYSHLLELGCSIGELTRHLALRAARVTAVDVSPVALDMARKTCEALTNVRFVEALLPDGEWDGEYDAAVLSEILYYLRPEAIAALAARIASMAPQADIVLVHWTGETDYPVAGDEAVDTFIRHCPAHVVVKQKRTAEYRLELMRRKAPGSCLRSNDAR